MFFLVLYTFIFIFCSSSSIKTNRFRRNRLSCRTLNASRVFTCCFHDNGGPPTFTLKTRFCPSQMAGSVSDPSRAAVGFGRWSVPLLFRQLDQEEGVSRVPVLASLCDLVHDPERLYQTVTGGKVQNRTNCTPVQVRMKLFNFLYFYSFFLIELCEKF